MVSCPACWCPVVFKRCEGTYQCMECGCVFDVEEDEEDDDY